MIFGKTHAEREQARFDAEVRFWNKGKPTRVFVWFPRRDKTTGRMVTLAWMWRICLWHSDRSGAYTKYYLHHWEAKKAYVEWYDWPECMGVRRFTTLEAQPDLQPKELS